MGSRDLWNGTGTIAMPDINTPKSANIRREISRINCEEREKRNGHRALTLWLTGLSGSGKSTLAMELERPLVNM